MTREIYELEQILALIDRLQGRVPETAIPDMLVARERITYAINALVVAYRRTRRD